MQLQKILGRSPSLRRTLVAVLSIILVVLVFVVATGVISFTFRTEKQFWDSRRLDAAINAAEAVNTFIDRIQNYISIVGRINPSDLHADSSYLNSFLAQEPALLEIILIDNEGQIITSANRGEAVLSNLFTIPQSSWFITAEAGKPYYGRVEISAQNQPYMLVAVPSMTGGVVAARLNMNILWSVVSDIRFGESGQVYVVDRSTREVIAHPDSEIVFSRTTVTGLPQEKALADIGFVWQSQYSSLSGERVLGSAIFVPEKNWVMFAEVSLREAYANTRRGALILVAFYIILSIIIAVVSNRFLRQTLFNPIDKLRLSAEKIGAGELDHQIDPEVFTEISDLGLSFNEMAEKLRRRETALKETRDQAMAANRFKGQILAHVSHDLRTPINAIMGYSELLKEELDGPLNESQRKSSERIYANSRRLLNLVNGLLDQSQLERGTFTTNYALFTPQKLVENAQATYEPLANIKDLTLHLDIDKTCPKTLYGDFERTQQIVSNLLDNAIKFTEKGEVCLNIFSPDKDFWAFSVSDTGPGIAVEDQAIIFQAFRQLDGLATRKHGGVGLGLSIAQQLTKILQGKIWVESEISKGSKFTVILPANSNEENSS